MKSLEEMLQSTGRVTWSQNITLWKEVSHGSFHAAVERKEFYSEVTNAIADPKNCSLKVLLRTNLDPSNGLTGTGEHSGGGLYYLEELYAAFIVDASSNKEDVQPFVYSIYIVPWRTPVEFKFRNKESAGKVATLLGESIKQCSAAPLASRSAASTGPSLAETLSFIADKLTTQGRVEAKWIDVVQGVKTDKPPISDMSVDYFQVTPIPTACSLGFDSVEGFPSYSHTRLSFRRIGKVERLKLKDYLASYTRTSFNLSTGQHDRLQATEVSPSFVLNITSSGGESKQLFFSDESLADRVANAMVHAAEICGAGTNREPF
jgi:hypothetical protein